jgi:beta-galactosidase
MRRLERVQRTDNSLRVTEVFAAAAGDLGFRTHATWSWDGGLVLEFRATPFGQFRTSMEAEAAGFGRSAQLTMPRLGISFSLGLSASSETEWLGFGPGESYPDARGSVHYGIHRATVGSMQTRYVRPQENGRRSDVRFLNVQDAINSVRIDLESAKGITIRPWSQDELTRATHTYDLHAKDELWFHLDDGIYGVGSAACGPDAFEPYRLVPREFDVRLRLSIRATST